MGDSISTKTIQVLIQENGIIRLADSGLYIGRLDGVEFDALPQTDATEEKYRALDEDYKALTNIIDRARKLANLREEEEEERPRFRMDANGNLTRIEDARIERSNNT